MNVIHMHCDAGIEEWRRCRRRWNISFEKFYDVVDKFYCRQFPIYFAETTIKIWNLINGSGVAVSAHRPFKSSRIWICIWHQDTTRHMQACHSSNPRPHDLQLLRVTKEKEKPKWMVELKVISKRTLFTIFQQLPLCFSSRFSNTTCLSYRCAPLTTKTKISTRIEANANYANINTQPTHFSSHITGIVSRYIVEWQKPHNNGRWPGWQMDSKYVIKIDFRFLCRKCLLFTRTNTAFVQEWDVSCNMREPLCIIETTLEFTFAG